MGDAKYTYTFTNDGGIKYRVDFILDGYTGDSSELNPTEGGFMVQYQEMQNEIYTPFIPIDFTAEIINDVNGRALLQELMDADTVGNWFCTVSRFNGATYDIIWRFVVNIDGITLPDSATTPAIGSLTIKADDGFGYLQELRHNDTEAQFLQTYSLIYPFYGAIKAMTKDILIDVDDPFLALCSNWYEQHMEQDNDIDPFSKLYIDGSAFVEADEFGVTQGMTWRDILENILASFNLTMFQYEGLYYVINFKEYQNTSKLFKYIHFKRTVDDPDDYIKGTIITGVTNLPTKFAGGEYSSLKQVSRVISRYDYKTSIYGNSLLPSTILPSPITSFGVVSSPVVYELCVSEIGYPLHFQGSIVANLTHDDFDNTDLRLIVRFRIKCGASYYLINSGFDWIWGSDSVFVYPQAFSTEFKLTFSIGVKTLELNIDTFPLPTSGDTVTFEVYSVDLVDANTGSIYTPPSGVNEAISLEFQNDWSANIGTAGQMAGTEGYVAYGLNTTEYELPGTNIGDAGYNFHVSKLRVKNASDVIENTTLWARLTEGYYYNLHEFRAYEMQSFWSRNISIFKTTINGEINFLNRYRHNTLYWAVVGATYYANANKWDCTLMQLTSNYAGITVEALGTANGNSHSSGGTYVGSGVGSQLWRRSGTTLVPYNNGDAVQTSGDITHTTGTDDYVSLDVSGVTMGRTDINTVFDTFLKGTFEDGDTLHQRKITSPNNDIMALEEFKAAGDEGATNAGATYELSTAKENDTTTDIRLGIDKYGDAYATGYFNSKKCGVFAYLTADAATTITTAGTYYPIAGTFTNDPLEDFVTVADPAIQYKGTKTQYFEIDWHATVAADQNSTTIVCGIKKNGTLLTSSRMGTLCKTANEMYNISGTVVVELTTDDKIQLVVTSDGNGDILTFHFYTTTIREFFD